MTTVGPVDHIARSALPWRTAPHLTECGKDVAGLGSRVVSRAVIEARIRDVGKMRAAYSTCMTCVSTASRHAPRQHGDEHLNAITREISALAYARPPREAPSGGPGDEHDQWLWTRRKQLVAEVEAIVALVQAHPDEFQGYLSGLGETVSLADRRTAKRRAGGVR